MGQLTYESPPASPSCGAFGDRRNMVGWCKRPARWRRKHMELLTQEDKRQIPRFEMTMGALDPMVHVVFHMPMLDWTWYVIEYNGKNEVFALEERERTKWGFYDLNELQDLRGPFGLRVQRAQHYLPMPLGQARHEVLSRHF